jgi:hypothetical protein
MDVDFTVTATPLPAVAGFTFTIGGKVAKIDKLIYSPDSGHVDELLALVLVKGSPCETAYLRCDDQGEYGKYVNTQFQLGGSETYVKRTDASKQSTSFTQANISFDARRHKMANQALRAAHDYSYRTQKVVVIDLAPGAATVGFGQGNAGVINLSCSNCTFTKVLAGGSPVPTKCPQCKKVGTIQQG